MKSFKKYIKNNKGFSLLETLIATLLISVVVTSVFSVALTAKTQAKKTDRRASALLQSKQVMEKVKAYVTGDRSAAAAVAAGAPANWRIPEDLCDSGLGTCSANCYALEVCTHDLTPMLPTICGSGVGVCSGTPVNGKITYVVTSLANTPTGCSGDDCAKSVTFTIKWDE